MSTAKPKKAPTKLPPAYGSDPDNVKAPTRVVNNGGITGGQNDSKPNSEPAAAAPKPPDGSGSGDPTPPTKNPYTTDSGSQVSVGDATKLFTQTLLTMGFDQATIDALMADSKDASGNTVDGITTLITKGFTGTDMLTMLGSTQVFKQRFSANDDRIKAGLQPLSYSEYLGMEKQYAQVMADAGLPKGFYDNPSQFKSLIAGDLSVNEVSKRVNDVSAAVTGADPQLKQALQQYYGLDDSHLMAHFLDPTVASPILDAQAQAANVGAMGIRAGINVNKNTAETISNQNFTSYSLHSGFAQINTEMSAAKSLAALSGDTWDTQQALNDAFNLDGGASSEKKLKLASQERARFSGSSAVGTGSLAGQVAGAI